MNSIKFDAPTEPKMYFRQYIWNMWPWPLTSWPQIHRPISFTFTYYAELLLYIARLVMFTLLQCQHSRSASSSAARRFHWGGGSLAPRVWVTKVPTGSQGWSPGWESGEQTLQDAEAICKRCLEVLTAETIKMWICPIHLLILDQNVSRWGGGLSEPFRG